MYAKRKVEIEREREKKAEPLFTTSIIIKTIGVCNLEGGDVNMYKPVLIE